MEALPEARDLEVARTEVRRASRVVEAQASAAGTKPLDSRFRGNDGYAGNDSRRESDVSRSNDVIPAKAGIQKRERFFVTLRNTSWIRACPGSDAG